MNIPEVSKFAMFPRPPCDKKVSTEKRLLLDGVFSNCIFDGLTVYPTYRKPFDLIAEGISLQFKLPE